MGKNSGGTLTTLWSVLRVLRRLFFLCIFLLTSSFCVILYRLSLGPLSMEAAIPYLLWNTKISCKTLQLQWISGLKIEVTGEDIRGESFSIPRVSACFSLEKLFHGSWKPLSLLLECPSIRLSLCSEQKGEFTLPLEWRHVDIDVRDATLITEIPDNTTLRYQHVHVHTERRPSAHHLRIWQRPVQGEETIFCVMNYAVKKDTVQFSGKIHGLPVAMNLLWPELRGILLLTGDYSGHTTASCSSWAVNGTVKQKDICTTGLVMKNPNAILKDFHTTFSLSSHDPCEAHGGAFLDAAGFIWSFTGKTVDDHFSFQGKLRLDTGYISAEALAYSWPPSVGVNARSWILENFKKGEFAQADGVFDGHWSSTDGLIADDFHGILGIENVVLSFIPGVPFIYNLKAISSVDLKKFTITVEGGEFQGQKIKKGTIVIGPLLGLPYLDMDLFIEGPLQPLLETLNCPRFGFLKHVPLDMNSVKGRWSGKLSSVFPLLMKLKIDDILIKVHGALKDVAFMVKLSGMPLNLSHGDLAVALTEKDIFLQGKSLVHTIPIQWKLKQDFYCAEEGYVDVTSLTSWSDVEKIFPHTKDICMGSFGAHVKYYPSKKSDQVQISLDLSHSTVTLPWIQWKKPSPMPLTASSVITLAEGKKIKSIRCTSNGALRGKGDFVWGGNQDTWTIEKAALTIDHPFSYKAVYSYSPREGYFCDMRAHTIDLSWFLSSDSSNNASSSHKKSDEFLLNLQEQNALSLREKLSTHEKKWRIHLLCTKCILADAVIENLHGDLQGMVQETPEASTIRWGKGSLQGVLSVFTKDESGSSEKKVLVEPPSLLHFSSVPQASGDTHLTFSNSQMGDFLRGSGLVSELYGGKTHIFAVQKKDGQYYGHFTLSHAEVQTPYLMKILAMISPTGFLEFFSSRLIFPLVKGDFFYKDGRLTLKKCVARGINLGLFLEGNVYPRRKSMSLHGVLVPIYWLNTLFTYVPVVGWILGGDKGILSTEFEVYGPFDDPHVSIAPLSILKAGFLKDIVDALEEDGSTKENAL